LEPSIPRRIETAITAMQEIAQLAAMRKEKRPGDTLKIMA
jgi:hypothetical protein